MKVRYTGPIQGDLIPDQVYEVSSCHFISGDIELVGIEGKFNINNFKLLHE